MQSRSMRYILPILLAALFPLSGFSETLVSSSPQPAHSQWALTKGKKSKTLKKHKKAPKSKRAPRSKRAK